MINIIGYDAEGGFPDVIQNGQHIGQHHNWILLEIEIYLNNEDPWTLLDRTS